MKSFESQPKIDRHAEVAHFHSIEEKMAERKRLEAVFAGPPVKREYKKPAKQSILSKFVAIFK